jgi:hypothetical protein
VEILFPILFIVVAASILVFLIVAVRSFLTSKGKGLDIDNEQPAGPELSGLSTSDDTSFSDSDKPSPGDAFGGGGDFGGGGGGGSFEPEVGGGLIEPDAQAGSADFGDSGTDAGDSGGGSGDGGSGE